MDEMTKWYVDHGGTMCPYCKESDTIKIVQGGYLQGTDFISIVKCRKCDQEFEETYSLSKVIPCQDDN